MEYRTLGNSGLKVPVLSLGAATFGGEGPFFSHWGNSDVKEARELIDLCLEHGVNLFDTADVYSHGNSEKVLGGAIKGIREQVLISTKTTLPMGDGPMDAGYSRKRLLNSVEGSLKRLNVDYIDLFILHAYDRFTPAEELLSTLDTLVQQGKILYYGVSNFSGWELMNQLAVADTLNVSRHILHQVYYSLIGRDYEWELMPLGQNQNVGAMVWSPLGWGRLTGKIRRGQPLPETSRLHETASFGPAVQDDYLYNVIDVLDEIAAETGKSIPQIAINWLLQRPTVSTVVMGARNAKQLKDNLGAVGWQLTDEQMKRLNAVSNVMPPYPYYPYRVQEGFARVNPPIV